MLSGDTAHLHDSGSKLFDHDASRSIQRRLAYHSPFLATILASLVIADHVVNQFIVDEAEREPKDGRGELSNYYDK